MLKMIWDFFVSLVHNWLEFPTMLKVLWLVAVPTFFTATVWTIMINRSEKSPERTPQEKIITANEAEGFEEVFRTRRVTGDGDVVVITQLHRKPQNPDGSISFRVARVHDASQTRFEWTVFLDDKTWSKGSFDKFNTDVGSGIGIEKALDQQHLRSTISNALDVLCIGLASSEQNLVQSNEVLSHSRAINLCRALINLGFIDENRQDYLAISYGEARPPEQKDIDVAKQRTAILIGVVEYAGDDDEDTVMSTITKLLSTETPVAGVRLQNYSLFGEPAKYWSFGSGELVGYEDMDWNQSDSRGRRSLESNTE
ncbi:MAG: hypothetical protein L3J02_00585 [Henriciella sp.]|nr:hypothetical protein [Henriciella sp.]